MLNLFDLLLLLYPANFRIEFGQEMRRVFCALARARIAESRVDAALFVFSEYSGLLRGALTERCQQFQNGRWQTSGSFAAGALLASGMHMFAYWCLVPIKGHGFKGLWAQISSRLLMLILAVGLAVGQPLPRQNPAVLETAREIYRKSFTALRDANTIEDMRRISGELDSPDWVSVDRFGRRILTTPQDRDKEFESMLSIPKERRVSILDIVWAERDSSCLIVVGWMMPYETTMVDESGEYGPKGTKHRLKRGTLIRDIFVNSEKGWRRISHDKLLPNGAVLAVDEIPRILPPLDNGHRVTSNSPQPR